MVILLGPELKTEQKMEAVIIQVAFEFSILTAVQNLNGFGCKLKKPWRLFVVGCYMSERENMHSVVHLTQMKLPDYILVYCLLDEKIYIYINERE